MRLASHSEFIFAGILEERGTRNEFTDFGKKHLLLFDALGSGLRREFAAAPK
jgi:hypothetical protein